MLVSDTQIILQDGRRKNWFWESNSIFDCNLSCYALVVRLYLARCAGENRVAFPSISNIAAHCGISRATVKRALAELEEKGLLLKETRQNESGEYTSNVYILLDPKVPASEGSEIPTQGSRFSQNPPCRYMTGVGSTGTYYPPGVVGSDRTDLGSDRATEEDSLKNNNVVVVNKAPIAETSQTLLTGTNRCAIPDDPGYEAPLRIIREGTFGCLKTGIAGNSDTGIPGTLVLEIPATGIPTAGHQVIGIADSERTGLAPDELIDFRIPNSISDNYYHSRVQEDSVNCQDNRGNQGTRSAKPIRENNCNDNASNEIKDHPSAGPAREIQEAFIKATGQLLTAKALRELTGYPLDYVLAKIAMVEVGKEKMNATGWLLEACREDYQHLPVKARKRRPSQKSPPAQKLPDTSKDDKYRDLYRLV